MLTVNRTKSWTSLRPELYCPTTQTESATRSRISLHLHSDVRTAFRELDSLALMNNVALYSFCLIIACAAVRPLQAQTPENLAVDEAARRQAWKIEMDRKLAEAQAAEKKGAFGESAQLYTECLVLNKKIGPGVSAEEQKQMVDGLVATRTQLAEQAQRAGDYGAADDQYAAILREDPKNEHVLQLREANRKMKTAED